MIFANENYEGIDVKIEKEGIYIYPRKVGGLLKGLGIAELPFTADQLQEILARQLKDKVFEITGSHFFGFRSSYVGWDDIRDRMYFGVRWGYSAPPGHPCRNRAKTENEEMFVALIWEAMAILEGEDAIKKRKRQVRDALNKCASPETIEKIGAILSV